MLTNILYAVLLRCLTVLLCFVMAENRLIVFTVTLFIYQFVPSFAKKQNELSRSSFGVLHTMHNLTAWANAEEIVVEKLTERIGFIEEEINLIKRFLTDYEESTGKAMDNLHDKNLNINEKARVVGSSYVLGHRMTSRLCGVTKSLRNLHKLEEYVANRKKVQEALTFVPEEVVPDIIIPEDTPSQANAKISKRMAKQWPDWQDQYMSLNSLITLNEELGIPPDKLAKGFTFDTAFGGYLTPENCVELGMFALSKEKYDIAVDWLEFGLQLAQDNEITAVPADTVYGLLYVTIQEHNRKLMDSSIENWKFHHSNLNLFIHSVTNLRSTKERRRLTIRKAMYLNNRGLGQDKLNLAQHIDICIGNNRQTHEIQKNFRCFYENKRHPYLYINPVKAEILSEIPPIIKFYEMIGNSTIERIKGLSRHYMSLSPVVEADTTDWITIASLRTSVSSAIDHQNIINVLKLAEMVSGLDIRHAATPTNVLEYTYGRQCFVHSDFFPEEDMPDKKMEYYGDRLATMLYYLEAPVMGGATSFCQAGRGAHGTRGSAIFWYSMYRNGTGRRDVDHGACPVFHGHKIVMNHWIRYKGNWNTYKCSLNQFE